MGLDFLQDELASRRRSDLLRTLRTVEGPQGPTFVIEGREYVNFSSNDYLGLANDPRLLEAARGALDEAGLGAGASRLITGDMTHHRELEAALAELKGTEAVLVFNSGYQANVGTIPALVGREDVVLSDQLNHASIIDGVRLSRAECLVYRHADLDDLENALKACRSHRRRLIVTDALFSMDGDYAPLEGIAALGERYDATVYVDEAHTTGLLGENGSGLCEHLGVADRIDVQMGTLGKALGSFGAYVAGSENLRTHLLNTARAFVFTTALPPSVCAAARAAVGIVRSDTSGLRRVLWENVQYFRAGLDLLGVDYKGSTSQIFPVVLGDARATMEASEALKACGVYAHGIRPPTVPVGTSRIRMTVSAGHTREMLDRALSALESTLGRKQRLAVTC